MYYHLSRIVLEVERILEDAAIHRHALSFPPCARYVYQFFLGDHTLSRKKIVQKPRQMLSRAIQYKLPIHQFWSNWVKVIKSMCTWAEILQMYGFPIQIYWENFKGP